MRRATAGCHLTPYTRDVKALNITTDAGHPALGAALAGAALAGAPPSAARLRAVVLRQQANACAAALDDVAGCITAIGAGFLAVDEADHDPIAGTVADTYGLTLLPPVAIGCSHEHAAWTGTVSISSTTLTSVVRYVSEYCGATGWTGC